MPIGSIKAYKVGDKKKARKLVPMPIGSIKALNFQFLNKFLCRSNANWFN